MNARRRYVALSAVLLLSGASSSAYANSALDPYASIQAPTRTDAKKNKKGSQPAYESVDNIATPKTYISMPMGAPKEEKDGHSLIGGMFSGVGNITDNCTKGFKAAGSGMAKIGGSIASGAKASGGAMAKGAGAIGDKLKDGTQAVGSKVADMPVPHKPGSKPGPTRTASLNGLYEDSAKKNLAANNDKVEKSAKEAIGHPEKGKSTVLPIATAKPKHKLIPSVSLSALNPFSKKDGKADDSKEEIAASSGFAQAALDKSTNKMKKAEQAKQDALAAIQQQPATSPVPGAKPAQTAPAAPAAAPKQIAAKPVKKETKKDAGAKAASEDKHGILSALKLKPAIPSMPSLHLPKKKHDDQANPLANEPQSGFTAVAKEQRVNTARQKEAAKEAQVAKTVGVPKPKAVSKPEEAGSSKLSAVTSKMGGAFAKLKVNPFHKNSQTASKKDNSPAM